MLIRLRGYHDGVKEYLENGLKAGNSLHRDYRDKRVVIDGVLDVTQAVYQSLNNSGERYLHYTLSFKEEHVDIALLEAISLRFKTLLMNAYQHDEFNFYSEAHLPKIKSFVNESTGEVEDRLPHLHIVIPKFNLMSGKSLDPVGLLTRNVKYLEAIQESINHEFNLESPRDNRRSSLSDVGEIISRYKGDVFKTDSHGLKERLLNDILNTRIDNVQSFLELLKTKGVVKERNSGSTSSYFNIKPSNSAKGVNLKEWVFSNEFIELPYEKKVDYITGDVKKRSVQQRNEDYSRDLELVNDWCERRSHEIKLMNPNSKDFKLYKSLPTNQKTVFLKNLQYADRSFLNSIRAQNPVEARANLLQDMIRQSLRGQYEQITSNSSLTRRQQAARRNSLRRMSPVHVALQTKLRRSTETEVDLLLSDKVRSYLGHNYERTYHNVRYTAATSRRPGIASTADLSNIDSVVKSVIAELETERSSRENERSVNWRELASKIDTGLFLDNLVGSHAIKREHYSVVSGKDGTDRIQARTRRYSLNDFLTKELHLSWKEASQCSGILNLAT